MVDPNSSLNYRRTAREQQMQWDTGPLQLQQISDQLVQAQVQLIASALQACVNQLLASIGLQTTQGQLFTQGNAGQQGQYGQGQFIPNQQNFQGGQGQRVV